MKTRSLFAMIVMLSLLTQACISPSPTVYVAELSPDKTKMGYVKEYYASLLHYPIPVYPKYSLVVRYRDRDRVLYDIKAKELMVRFVLIAWSDDSKIVVFSVESVNALTTIKAFDTDSGEEVPFLTVATAVREQIIQRWGRFVPVGTDPLTVLDKPTYELSKAFNEWRVKRFGFSPASLKCCR
jgi:hypothetical protein